MTPASSPSPSNAKKRVHPLLLATGAVVMILLAMFCNLVWEMVGPRLFAPSFMTKFSNGRALAANDAKAGQKMMLEAIAESEKKDGEFQAKRAVNFDYGSWLFNQTQLPNHYALAHQYYEKSVPFAKRAQMADQEALALSLMSECDYYQNIVRDGLPKAEEAVQIKKRINIGEGPIADATSIMGRAAMDAGDLKKAEDAFSFAYETFHRTEGPASYRAEGCKNYLACVYALEGKRELADKTFIENMAALDEKVSVGSRAADEMTGDYVRALKKTGDLAAAKLLATRLEDEDLADKRYCTYSALYTF
jgi:hypothetical protein